MPHNCERIAAFSISVKEQKASFSFPCGLPESDSCWIKDGFHDAQYPAASDQPVKSRESAETRAINP